MEVRIWGTLRENSRVTENAEGKLTEPHSGRSNQMLEPKVQSQSTEGKQEPKRCQGGGWSRKPRAVGGRQGECEWEGYCAVCYLLSSMTI